jgi:two-component sensor histidine kinase
LSGIDFRRTESLGLKLVCTLTEQLSGTIALQRDSGTRFTIRFREL